MIPIILGHIDEHIIEFLECVIVSITAEYVWHLFIHFGEFRSYG